MMRALRRLYWRRVVRKLDDAIADERERHELFHTTVRELLCARRRAQSKVIALRGPRAL